MNPGLAVVLLLFVLAYGAVAVFAIRRPLLGRLAIREAIRRKGQSLLVVAGLMVGTATITAALIAADSVGDSAVDAFAYGNWHHVDLTVTATNRTFPKEVADRLAESPSLRPHVDGVAAGIDLVGSAADLTSRQGSSRVTLVGFDPAAQPPFGAFVLLDGRSTYGEDMAPNGVLLSRTLADKLDARVGDLLVVSLESSALGSAEPVQLRVAGIARQEGPSAYTLGSVVFAPLRTAQRVAGTNEINIVRVSAPGEVRDSLDAARRAKPVLDQEADALRRDFSIPLEVREAKARDVENSTEFTSFIRFTPVATTIATFAIRPPSRTFWVIASSHT